MHIVLTSIPTYESTDCRKAKLESYAHVLTIHKEEFGHLRCLIHISIESYAHMLNIHKEVVEKSCCGIAGFFEFHYFKSKKSSNIAADFREYNNIISKQNGLNESGRKRV